MRDVDDLQVAIDFAIRNVFALLPEVLKLQMKLTRMTISNYTAINPRNNFNSRMNKDFNSGEGTSSSEKVYDSSPRMSQTELSKY